MQSLDAKRYSQQLIMQALVDGLLVEGLLDKLNAEWINIAQAAELLTQLPVLQTCQNDASKRLWRWPQDQQHSVIMLLQPGITQAWERVPQTPVMLLNHATRQGSR